MFVLALNISRVHTNIANYGSLWRVEMGLWGTSRRGRCLSYTNHFRRQKKKMRIGNPMKKKNKPSVNVDLYAKTYQ